jgi:hypothetical protein
MHASIISTMGQSPTMLGGSKNPTTGSSKSPALGSVSGTAGDQKTINGAVTSSQNGAGTFSKMMEEVNGQKVVDKTVTFANGKTRSTEKAITINDDGSKTIAKTGNNGKTSTIQETFVPSATGGTSFTKEKTGANGNVTEISGTKTQNADGSMDAQITRTNAAGQTETLDRATTKSDGYRSTTTTGTGYTGNPIHHETSWRDLTVA